MIVKASAWPLGYSYTSWVVIRVLSRSAAIEMVEANTYDVKCVHEGYEYVVRLTLVAEGNTYKIDTIKTISSQYF